MKSLGLVGAMIFLLIVFALTRDPISFVGFAAALPLLALHADKLRGHQSAWFMRDSPGWWLGIGGMFLTFSAGLIWTLLLALGLVRSFA
jgi:hypothetical protein